MKRLISLLLLICLLTCCIVFPVSCIDDAPEDIDPDGNEGDEEIEDPDDGDPSPIIGIIVPDYKDYMRDTQNFSDIVYSRPDIASLITALNNITELISANEVEFDAQIAAIVDVEDEYSHLYGMYSMAQIYTSKDASSQFWAEEHEYISTNLPAFNKALEAMFVAAARSVNAKRFEEEYFGDGLIERYANGSSYTDEVVELMSEEAEIISRYSALSTATIEVTYKGTTDTVDNILADLADKYGTDSFEYMKGEKVVLSYYSSALKEAQAPIFVELIKVRKLIADALGYDSYATLAYKEMGHDYSTIQMEQFFNDIRQYIFPVYFELCVKVFESYFATSTMSNVNRIDLVNNMYALYKDMDEDLADIYAYMLQHGLYDVDASSPNRFDGAFTSYVNSNNSPFLFVTMGGKSDDYLTLAHEFGHFADGFVNYGNDASLDMSEVSSCGLEFLTLFYLDKILSEEEAQYLKYYELFSSMDSLLIQGLIACFEHYIYELDYDQITESNLNDAMRRASITIFGQDYYDDYTLAIMIHTVEYPFYVQSYCTSATPALELFFMEVEEEGRGLEAYKNLIDREDISLSDRELLEEVGLSSPFKENLLRDLADDIHYYVLGSHYFVKNDNPSNAA